MQNQGRALVSSGSLGTVALAGAIDDGAGLAGPSGWIGV